MSALESSCPSCGAPIAFKAGSSIVVICDFCHSAVARGDRALEDLGKVAELVQTGSPLDTGLRGAYQGIGFVLTGRAQLGHEAGGIWDEWYAAFDDGRLGWLAEAQGRFYMTFQMPMDTRTLIPPFVALGLGDVVAGIPSSTPMVVAEKGVARYLGAKGEIPYRLVPGEEYKYADISGSNGEFGTLDFSARPPLVFIGRQLSLDELGIPESALAPEREPRRVESLQLSCPNCAGPLELRAPDLTERVGCPNCGSLLDVNQGRLSFLKSLGKPPVMPIIPIGSVGEFDGARLTVIGFMQRSVKFDRRYYWEEYLLYNPRVGFRWLVRSDENWSFVQPVEPGQVVSRGRDVTFGGKKFKLYQDATARVEYVTGEFYWKVNTMESTLTADYVRPPLMLSKEISQGEVKETAGRRRRRKASSGEINWSLGLYVTHRAVEKAFNIRRLPRTSKIAPNQPFKLGGIYKYWGLLIVILVAMGIIVMAAGPRTPVFAQRYEIGRHANADTPQVFFTDAFQLKGGQNVKITGSSPVDNNWVGIQGDLVEEATGLVQEFTLPIEYYHGVEDGERWSEGSRVSSTHLSALPAGSYTLRLEVYRGQWDQPGTLTIQVQQGVPRLLHFFLTLIAVSIIPLLVAIYQFSFEKRRWEDSDYSPFS